jgi:DMSO/TMAO reductase YedYZ molybdopterin-dependent catalytic subunit
MDRGGDLNKAMRGLLTAITVSVVAMALLLVGVLILGDREEIGPGRVLISGKVANGGEYDLDGLRRFGEVDIRMVLLGTGEDGKEHNFKGIPLEVLVLASGPDLDATRVTVSAQDGYSKTFDIEDLDDAFIVWEKDGGPIPPRSRAGDGPFRLIISQDKVGTYNAQHCVKWVSEVRIG